MTWREAYDLAFYYARKHGSRRRVLKTRLGWTWVSTSKPRREIPHPTPTEEGNG